MKLLRSETPELAHSIASSRAWASRNWYTLRFACAANVIAFFIAVAVSLSISMRAAGWLTVPILFALNGYVLWRAKASRQKWVLVGSGDRLYVRLFAWRSGNHGDVHDPDVLVLEPPDIASMSIRTMEVFLYGPKPRFVKWLVIEPAQIIADDISRHIRPLLTPDRDKAVLVEYGNGRLTIEWKWWRPALQVFLQQIAQEFPSLVIAPEESSELDLNAIWSGISLNLDAQKRQLLVHAKRLGFGCDCTKLLSRYKYISFRQAAAYVAKIEREEGGKRYVR